MYTFILLVYVYSLALLTISADSAIESSHAFAEEALGDQHTCPTVQARIRVTRTCSDTHTSLFACPYDLHIFESYTNKTPIRRMTALRTAVAGGAEIAVRADAGESIGLWCTRAAIQTDIVRAVR